MVSLTDLKNETMIHCMGKTLALTSSYELLLPIKDDVKHTYCNSITLWGKMIANNNLGVGLIVERGMKQGFREGEIDKSKVIGLPLDFKPVLDCVCVYRQDAPSYIWQIASEMTVIKQYK